MLENNSKNLLWNRQQRLWMLFYASMLALIMFRGALAMCTHARVNPSRVMPYWVQDAQGLVQQFHSFDPRSGDDDA